MFLICVGSNCEKDYQCKYLLQNVHVNNYAFLPPSQFTNQFMDDWLKGYNKEEYILIVGAGTMTFQRISEAVEKFKPKILIINGDEHKQQGQLLTLADKVDLMLYQYIGHYRTDARYTQHQHKIVHVPQGWYPGIFKYGVPLPKNDLLPNNRESRKYVWSFMGNVHHKRTEGLCKFTNAFEKDEYFVSESGHNRKDLIDVCKQSQFVLNLHAFGTLESPRLCYTIRCGAIPVVVGSSMDVIKNTFTFNTERTIPFVCATSWDEAIRECKRLLKTGETQVVFDKCWEWMNDIEEDIMIKIEDVCGSDVHFRNG